MDRSTKEVPDFASRSTSLNDAADLGGSLRYGERRDFYDYFDNSTSGVLSLRAAQISELETRQCGLTFGLSSHRGAGTLGSIQGIALNE